MKFRIFASGLVAFVLSACENPEGQTDRFLVEAAKHSEEGRGRVPPLPDYKPREVTPLRIERDPFKR